MLVTIYMLESCMLTQHLANCASSCLSLLIYFTENINHK